MPCVVLCCCTSVLLCYCTVLSLAYATQRSLVLVGVCTTQFGVMPVFFAFALFGLVVFGDRVERFGNIWVRTAVFVWPTVSPLSHGAACRLMWCG